MTTSKWIVECVSETEFKILNKEGEYSEVMDKNPVNFASHYEARVFADELNTLIEIREQREKLQSSLIEFGCDFDVYINNLKNQILYKNAGGFTEILKLLSTVASQIAHGDDFHANLNLNKAKAITIMMADGKLDFLNSEKSPS
jgi:hypothetical protein